MIEAGSHAAAVHAAKRKEKKAVKCVVWDLDNTVWDGILLEDREVVLRPHVVVFVDVAGHVRHDRSVREARLRSPSDPRGMTAGRRGRRA